jgi:RNA polymerase sigma-70 factor (ECF subfamily)
MADWSKIDDTELVRRCLSGDRSLFSEVVQRYQNNVYGLCLRKVADLGQAQDIAQETFVVGYENLARLKDPARLKAWLMGISSNLIRDYYKRRKIAGLPEGHDVEVVGMDPLESLEQRERHELLYKAIATLSERYKAVLIKRYLEEAEYPEIAADLGLSIGAVEVCMHRARKALAGALKELMPDV